MLRISFDQIHFNHILWSHTVIKNYNSHTHAHKNSQLIFCVLSYLSYKLTVNDDLAFVSLIKAL